MYVEDSGLKERLKQRVMSRVDLTGGVADDEIGRIIDECILEETKDSFVPLKEKIQLRRELFNSFRRLDVLTEYLEEDDVSEIMVNGRDNIFVEKNGYIVRTDKSFDSMEKLNSVAQQIVADCNRRINEANPIVDARLKDGSRVNIVMNPVSLSGPVITIRKFPKEVMSMQQLCRMGTLSEEAAGFLEILVKSRYNIFVSGATSTGKTTFLNALCDFVPKDERIITIEDSAELKITGVDNLVRLETRNPNMSGEGEITIRDLIKASLRMRPDRVIVGEVRDAAAIDMLQAMGTGHDGSLSTGHANSAADMLTRLETMVLMGMELPVAAIRKQIASAVDIIIHLGRTRDKSRRVMSIDEVIGMKDGEVCLNRLYEFVETGKDGGARRVSGQLEKINELIHMEKIMTYGQLKMYREVCCEAG